jgi:hypothetical protein
MALIQDGTSGNLLKVNSDSAAHASVRPPAFGALGAYSKGLTSGIIPPTGAVGALIWALRWTDATRFALIERIRVSAVVNAAVTAGVPYNLQLFLCRGFTVAPTTSIGTTGTFTTANAKRRTAMGSSLMSGIWIVGAVAAGMTGQTLAQDTDPLSVIAGGIAAAAPIGAQVFGPNPTDIWNCAGLDGQHPIILAANEGLSIVAPLAGPATGSHQIAVDVDWMEVAAY